MKILKIFLYDEPSVPELKVDELCKFVQDTFSVPVEKRKNIFSLANEKTASKLASCRIFNTRKPFETHSPTKEEIEFELATFYDSKKTENIVMYDGFEFQRIVSELISDYETTLDKLHIVFTNKLTCTYDDSDYRYHGRAVICSNPAIISTTGIVEAPAKPRGYYLELISNVVQGVNVETMKKKYQGTYLEYNDKRFSAVSEGYVLQVIFYYLTGEAFCESRECRLNNAHWQSDLLYSQLEKGKLCGKHQKVLEQLSTLYNNP
ncbi:MAG: hypothetical protein FJ360_02150 [Thaumarchaeota archaeon]|nr:hypothetical protein [Nitrososphaerota archaeon]